MNDLFSLDSLFDYLDSLEPALRDAMREYLAHCESHAALPEIAEQEKEEGEAEEVKTDFLFAVIDQRDILDRPSRKWYSPNTRLGDRTSGSRRTRKRGVCFHHTAVKNGFGPHKNVVNKYREQAHALGEINLARWPQLNEGLSVDQWARAMALAGRMRGEGRKDKFNQGVPYHVVRCANSVLVLNLPFEFVTWHGNGSNNDFAGFGWDAHSGKESIEDADDLCADAEFVVKTMRDEGHPANEFTAHCAYTKKPTDPGAEFISLVMEPTARETGSTIDYDFKVRGGRSIGEVLEAA